LRYLLERPEAHYTDNYAVSEEKSRLNKTVFRLRLKEVVDRCDLRSVDRVFHTRGAATAKALSPNLRFLRGTIRSSGNGIIIHLGYLKNEVITMSIS